MISFTLEWTGSVTTSPSEDLEFTVAYTASPPTEETVTVSPQQGDNNTTLPGMIESAWKAAKAPLGFAADVQRVSGHLDQLEVTFPPNTQSGSIRIVAETTGELSAVPDQHHPYSGESLSLEVIEVT